MADSKYLVLFDSEEEAIAAGYRKANDEETEKIVINIDFFAFFT